MNQLPTAPAMSGAPPRAPIAEPRPNTAQSEARPTATPSLRHVAVLGLGAMGSRMARRLLSAGFAVTVWNRTAAAAEALATDGCTVAGTPADAVRGADAVLAMLTDDDASAQVWRDGPGAALTALAPGTIVVESSTLGPAWVRALAHAVGEIGASFVDAPVAGSRPQAEAGQLVFFAGGDPAAIEHARPLFAALGSTVHTVGPAGRGAEIKLVVNALFAAQLAAMAEALALGDRLGVPPLDLANLLATLPTTSPAIAGMARMMASGDERPLFTIDLVVKDLRYLAALRADADVAGPALDAAAISFERARTAGLGAHNVTALARLHRDA
jgi:3-hydroxyisobutyrate dehydrogenase